MATEPAVGADQVVTHDAAGCVNQLRQIPLYVAVHAALCSGQTEREQ